MFEKVKEVLMEAINVDEDMIKLEANLKDDLGIDSWQPWSFLWSWKQNLMYALRMKSWQSWLP